MRRHRQRWPVALCVLLLVAGCDGAATPEAGIRELIDRTAEAAEDGDVGAVAEALHADYRDTRGNDRAAIVRMLRLTMLREGSMLVIPDVETIELHGPDAADVTLEARFAGADFRRMSVETGLYRVELELVREKDWRVISARWDRVDGSGG